MAEQAQELSGAEMIDAALDKFHQSKEAETDESVQEQDDEPSEAESGDDAEKKQQEGSKPIKIDDPAVRKRIDYLYKQVRSSDEANLALRSQQQEMEEALAHALKQLDKLTSKQQKDEDDSAISVLRQKIRDARALGDDDKVDELTELLIEAKAEQLVRKQVPAKKEEVKRPDNRQSASPYEKEEVSYVESLRYEVNDEGDFVRPWLHKGDADFDFAVEQGARIAKKYDQQGKQVSIATIMGELEKVMAAKNKRAGAVSHSVLPSSKGKPKDENTRMNERQSYVWKKLGLKEDQYDKRVAMIAKAKSVSLDDI